MNLSILLKVGDAILAYIITGEFSHVCSSRYRTQGNPADTPEELSKTQCLGASILYAPFGPYTIPAGNWSFVSVWALVDETICEAIAKINISCFMCRVFIKM